jgi:hypothetical protein
MTFRAATLPALAITMMVRTREVGASQDVAYEGGICKVVVVVVVDVVVLCALRLPAGAVLGGAATVVEVVVAGGRRPPGGEAGVTRSTGGSTPRAMIVRRRLVVSEGSEERVARNRSSEVVDQSAACHQELSGSRVCCERDRRGSEPTKARYSESDRRISESASRSSPSALFEPAGESADAMDMASSLAARVRSASIASRRWPERALGGGRPSWASCC